jgi:integrase
MGKTVAIIFLKQATTDKEGIIYVRTTEGRKSRRKSLGIKLKESDWKQYFNEKTERFRDDQRFGRAEEINDVITAQLKELSKNDNELALLPDGKKSFIKYWEGYIKTVENHGTRIKHEVVLAKLNKYLTAVNKPGLLFIEITAQFLREFRLYLLQTADPKLLSENSVNHYLKIVKSIANKAAKEDYYIYARDPFLTIQFKNKTRQRNVLNADELFRIIKGIFWDKKLYLVKDMFLFQVFANGMRVSDLLLLRWNNFENQRLSYVMFKTSTHISIPLNSNLAGIIHTLLGTTVTYKNLTNIFTQPTLLENNTWVNMNLKDIESAISKHAYDEHELGEGVIRNELNHRVERNEYVVQGNYYIKKAFELQVNNLMEARDKLLRRIDELYTSQAISKIRIEKKNNMNDFVFPILDNDSFKNIDDKNDFSKLTEQQYKAIKHATIVYNRNLKKLQKGCSINTHLSSHVARHSFTNLLLTMKDVNLYDISQSLGHSSLAITQNYINNGFNTDKVDYLNREFSKTYRKKI